MKSHSLTSNTLIGVTAIFIVATGNFTFFGKVLQTYGLQPSTLLPLASLVLATWAVTVLLLLPFGFARLCKPLLMLCLLASALAAHFMDSYGVVINAAMLRNAAQTQFAEVRDLINPGLFADFLLLGVLPAFLIARVEIRWCGWRRELLARLKFLALIMLILIVPGLLLGSFYASFLREHKALRAYANPAYPLYSLAVLGASQVRAAHPGPLVPVGEDAHISPQDPHHELIILVIGETARADHFSLNGYIRETNPLLGREDIVSFTDFTACATSTAESLPCMFALNGKDGSGKENLLDVLQRDGVNVLWLDNNSDSKGVALRADYRNFRSPGNNPLCDEECRDPGMLQPLQGYIDAHPEQDIFIVLHQMGNHGPAYYKRYPKAFEFFKPACQDSDLSRCSREEIINAYDNAVRYTDYFLVQAINLLKKNDGAFETALFYVSDHGESLGENGVYLHGLPRAIAPRAQLHVPAILWFGRHFDGIDRPALLARRHQAFSHENMFHTILGLFEIETHVYRPQLDLLNGSRKPETSTGGLSGH